MNGTGMACLVGALLAACAQDPGGMDRSELRDAVLLEDGKTAIVSFSSRRVKLVPVGLLDGGGKREDTVRHQAVLGRFDLTTKTVTRLAAFDLGTGLDHAHFQLLWSLGDHVLLRGTFPTGDAFEFDYALLDARTGKLDRLRLMQFAEEQGCNSLVDVRLVGADGSVAVVIGKDVPGAARPVWLRRVRGSFERLCVDGTLDGRSGEEVAFRERGAKQRSAFRFADGARRELHNREYADAFTPAHQDRPHLLQVRGLPGLGHGPLPKDGPYLALGRKEGNRWVEDKVPIDVAPLR